MEKKEPGKKLLIIYIVEILRRFSDEDHPLSQQRILELLDSEYQMEVDRKSIRRNLLRLRDAGMPIFCREAERVTNGKKEAISLDWYWKHILSSGDVHMLLDVLYFSRLPQQKVRQLADKLEVFRSLYFRDGKGAVKNLPHPEYQTLVDQQRPVVGLLSEAIKEKKKVRFYYDHYEADGKWHHDRSLGGEDRVHKVNPYSIMAADGRYFLLGNHDGEETVRIYRISRMTHVEVLEETVRPSRSVQSLENGIHPSSYLSVRSKVYEGGEEKCSLEVAHEALTELVEDFGKKVFIRSATPQWLQVEIDGNPNDILAWAMAEGERVRVTGPPLLVHQAKDQVTAMKKLYGGD